MDRWVYASVHRFSTFSTFAFFMLPAQHAMGAATREEDPAPRPADARSADVPRGGGRLQMRSQPAGKREARPGVAGSTNSGRPGRVMGGKGLSNRKKNIPPPFNNDILESLVKLSVHLLRDPAFCNAKVSAFLCTEPQDHNVYVLTCVLRACTHARPVPPPHALSFSRSRLLWYAQVLVPLLGACASLSAACLSAVWVTSAVQSSRGALRVCPLSDLPASLPAPACHAMSAPVPAPQRSPPAVPMILDGFAEPLVCSSGRGLVVGRGICGCDGTLAGVIDA